MRASGTEAMRRAAGWGPLARLLLALIVLAWAGAGGVSCASISKIGKGGSPASPSRLEAGLRQAEAAWAAARHPNASVAAVATYNSALEKVLADIQRGKIGREVPWAQPLTTPAYRLSFEPGAKNSPYREIYNLTEAIPAGSVKIRHAHYRVSTPGLGVPVVMVREPDTIPAKTSPFVPLNGRWLPATFVIDFSKPGQPSARFYNTIHSKTASIAGSQRPLATDFTAGLELSLGSNFLKKFALSGLLRPGADPKHTGLFLTETFDPKKIPVIMVHGLASDPHIWENPMNAILADPVLRDRYQLWYFLYPTGLPVTSTSNRLRQAIAHALEAMDPEDDDPALDNIVLIGHSMGGLLTRMQAIDSGNALWDSMFAVPPEKIEPDPKKRQFLANGFFFKRQDYIDRAVFIATPHRGSDIADWRPVRWAVLLIKLPVDILNLTTELAALDTTFFNPALRDFDAFGTRSVDNLSPRYPLLKGLAQRPILVPHHSIIGNRGRRGPIEKSSDGVVPYWSSHLDTALSEKIVPTGHSCVESPSIAEEIARILHEHLKAQPKGKAKRQTRRR